MRYTNVLDKQTYIIKHLRMVNAFDNIFKRQIIFAVVRKIGLKTILSDKIENSLMIYHCLLWNFTLSLLSIAQSTCVHKKGIFRFIYIKNRFKMQWNTIQWCRFWIFIRLSMDVDYSFVALSLKKYSNSIGFLAIRGRSTIMLSEFFLLFLLQLFSILPTVLF